MAHVIFGGRGKNRLRQRLVLVQSFRKLPPVDFSRLLVLSPAAACDIAPDDAFNVDALRLLGNHDPVS
ncbi:hypothetical protein D3C73_1649000 [compost metagenome]